MFEKKSKAAVGISTISTGIIGLGLPPIKVLITPAIKPVAINSRQ